MNDKLDVAVDVEDSPPVAVGNANTNKIINKYRNSFKYKPLKQDQKKEKVFFIYFLKLVFGFIS